MNQLAGVSAAAVQKATGGDWEHWLHVLDEAGAKAWSHKQIVAHLRDNSDMSGWWQQMVTVGYEQARGRRVLGQTAGTGFQLGVQKTIPIGLDEAWTLLSSRKGVACWLGKVSRFSLAEGKKYCTDDGICGEIRVVKPHNRIRLTWNQSGMPRPATLQISLIETGESKTSIRVHLEHLPSQEFREQMKSHWQKTLKALAQLAPAKPKKADA